MKIEAIRLKVEDFIFNRPRSAYALGGEGGVSFVIATIDDGNGNKVPHVEYVKNYGILHYYYGVPYPSKGHIEPEIMADLNGLKRLIINDIKLAVNPFVLIGLAFDQRKYIRNRAEVYEKIFGYHSIKSEWLTRCAYAVETFLRHMTDDQHFSNLVAQIPECDDVYRYRLQDFFTELDVIAFRKNPRKELRRLKEVVKSREVTWTMGVFNKIDNLFKVADILLLIPSVRKKVCDNIHYLKIGVYDRNDHYWVCLYDHGYHYLGIPIDERCKFYKEKPYMFRVKT